VLYVPEQALERTRCAHGRFFFESCSMRCTEAYLRGASTRHFDGFSIRIRFAQRKEFGSAPELDRIICRALAKNREKRYSSAHDLLETERLKQRSSTASAIAN